MAKFLFIVISAPVTECPMPCCSSLAFGLIAVSFSSSDDVLFSIGAFLFSSPIISTALLLLNGAFFKVLLTLEKSVIPSLVNFSITPRIRLVSNASCSLLLNLAVRAFKSKPFSALRAFKSEFVISPLLNDIFL